MSKALGKIKPKRVRVAVRADGTKEIIDEVPDQETQAPPEDDLSQVALPKIPAKTEDMPEQGGDDAAVFRRAPVPFAPSVYKKYQ